MILYRTTALLTLVGLVAMLAGCGALLRNPVPPELTAKATIPEMPEVRAWAGRVSPAMERDFARSFEQESPEDFPRDADGVVCYPHLALSGGGANGAFGAGFPERLVGDWEPPGLQDRHRRVDRRGNGAVRVSRTAV
jgi:hypothetical protein